jgi:hypothetical protein
MKPIIQFPSSLKGRIKLTETSLELSKDLSFEEWREVGRVLGRMESAVTWWCADFWAFGEWHYGERQDMTNQDDWMGPSFETCMNNATVARVFETSRRREVLSFTHHKEVAALEPEVADELLSWCEEPLSNGSKKPRPVADLQDRVREIRNGIALQESIKEPEAPVFDGELEDLHIKPELPEAPGTSVALHQEQVTEPAPESEPEADPQIEKWRLRLRNAHSSLQVLIKDSPDPEFDLGAIQPAMGEIRSALGRLPAETVTLIKPSCEEWKKAVQKQGKWLHPEEIKRDVFKGPVRVAKL